MKFNDNFNVFTNSMTFYDSMPGRSPVSTPLAVKGAVDSRKSSVREGFGKYLVCRGG